MVLGCCTVLVAGGVTVGRALYVVAGETAGAGAVLTAGADRGVYVVTPFSDLTADFSGAGADVEGDPARGVYVTVPAFEPDGEPPDGVDDRGVYVVPGFEAGVGAAVPPVRGVYVVPLDGAGRPGLVCGLFGAVFGIELGA